MGNQLAISGAAASINLVDISTNLNLVAPLGGAKRGRLFTSLHCKNNTNGNEVVVKIFVQKQEDKVQGQLLDKHQEALIQTDFAIRTYYKEHFFAPCNVLYYSLIERSKVGSYCMLQRPFIHYSLAERLQMRPFWEPCQRLFACYQLLQALYQLHDCCGTSHGDLKPENVLVTSCGWLYITDICPFKPAQLESFNPANFEYFYDTAENRNCCCAPEKFIDGDVNMKAAVQSATSDELFSSFYGEPVYAPSALCPHKAASDVFSAACVMVFILTDEPLFKLSGALEFRQKSVEGRHQFLESELSKRRVSPAMIAVIKAIMCCEDDTDRPTAKDILMKFTPSAFPPVFDMLFNNIMPVLITKSPDAQTLFLWSRMEDIMRSADHCAIDMEFARAVGMPDDRTLPSAHTGNNNRSRSTSRSSFTSINPSQPPINIQKTYANAPVSYEARSIVVSLLLPLIATIIRFVRTSDSRCRLAITMGRWVAFASEYACREVMLPWVRQMASSRRAGALPRAAAIRTILFIIQSLPSLSKLETFLFEDYILDIIEGILKEPGVIPPSFLEMQPLIVLLTEIAATLPLLLWEGLRFVTQRQRYYWEAMNAFIESQDDKPISKIEDVNEFSHKSIGQKVNSPTMGKVTEEHPKDIGDPSVTRAPHAVWTQPSYEEELREIRERGWECVKLLLGTGHSGIQIVILQQLPTLCRVLGQERASVDLMPQLTTFLSTPVVEVKAEMLRRTSFLAKFLRCGGGENEALVSLLVMALEDGLKQQDVSCVLSALRSITQIAVGRTLPINMVMQLTNASLKHVVSTNEWVKDEACRLIQNVARSYSPSDVILYLLKPMRSILTKPAPLANLLEYKHLIRLVPPKGMEASCFKKRRYPRSHQNSDGSVNHSQQTQPCSESISCSDFYTYVRNPRIILWGALVPPRTKEDLAMSAHVDIYAPTIGNLHLYQTPNLIESKRNTNAVSSTPLPQSNVTSLVSKAITNYADYDVTLAGEICHANTNNNNNNNNCHDNANTSESLSSPNQDPINKVSVSGTSAVIRAIDVNWRMSEFLPTTRQLKRIYRRRKLVAPFRLDATPLQRLPVNTTDRNVRATNETNRRQTLPTKGSTEQKNLRSSFAFDGNGRDSAPVIVNRDPFDEQSVNFTDWNVQVSSQMSDVRSSSITLNPISVLSATSNSFAAPSSGQSPVPSVTSAATDRGAIIKPYAAPLTEYIPSDSNTSVTCMSAAGPLLVTGGHRGLVQIWDIDNSDSLTYVTTVAGRVVPRLVPHTIQGVLDDSITPLSGTGGGNSRSLPSATFVQFLHSTASGSPIAIGGSDGLLRLVDPQRQMVLARYDYNTIQYTTISNVNSKSNSNNSLSCCARLSPNYMIVGCGDGTVCALDWRVNHPAVWKAHLKNRYGYTSALMSLYNTPCGVFGGGGGDPTSSISPLGEAYGVLAGSSEGYLSLFDLRFQMQVYSIDICGHRRSDRDAACVNAICADPMVTKRGNNKGLPAAPAAVVALSNGDISRYDLGTGTRNLRLIVGDYAATSSPYTIATESSEASYGAYRPTTTTDNNNNNIISGRNTSLVPHSRRPNATRALLQPQRSPLVISAGDDRRVRIWDLGTMSSSRTMSMENNNGPSAIPSHNYRRADTTGSSSYIYNDSDQSLREVCNDNNNNNNTAMGSLSVPPPLHNDGGITALCVAVANGQLHIVTAASGGSVKVWRNSNSGNRLNNNR